MNKFILFNNIHKLNIIKSYYLKNCSRIEELENPKKSDVKRE